MNVWILELWSINFWFIHLQVPIEFYDATHFCGKSNDGHNTNSLLDHDIKSYCISKSEKCKVVLDYLILDGQFLLNSNLQILREDALRMAINHFAENFHSLMEKIIFPIYEKRFLARHNFLEKNSAHYKESIFPEALEKQD